MLLMPSLDELIEYYFDDSMVRYRYKINAQKRGDCACPRCGKRLEVYSCKARDLTPPSIGFWESIVKAIAGSRPSGMHDPLEERLYLCCNCGERWKR